MSTDTGVFSVSIIGSVGLPARYGGWETLAHHLTVNLKDKVSFVVYCSKRNSQEMLPSINGARMIYIPLSANGIQSILYDFLSMAHACRRSKILLILGTSGCIFLPLIKCLSKAVIVTNIDGIEWRRQKWGYVAQKFLKISERFAVRYSDLVVSDNAAIQKYLYSNYSVTSDCIPYGGDHVERVDCADAKGLVAYGLKPRGYAFTVCRIEPENNLEMILLAFSLAADQKLVVVGNWRNSDFGVRLKKRFSGFSNLILLDAIYDQRKLDELRSNAALYVHGHSAGGTNPSLVEAMSLGLPVAAFDCVFNRETTLGKAFFFRDPKELIDIVVSVDSRQMAEAGRTLKSIADERYRWSDVTAQYLRSFKKLLGNGCQEGNP
jgi:glycosyltransferase involved in cell wall biosynthesis